MPPLLVINSHNGVPAYRQIMDQIKLQIDSGVLTAGDEMASTRVLAVELKLNPMTVSKAYALLERDGVLERRRGQTLVVRQRSAPEAEESRLVHLRQRLREAADVATQLGVSRAEALRLFRELLNPPKS